MKNVTRFIIIFILIFSGIIFYQKKNVKPVIEDVRQARGPVVVKTVSVGESRNIKNDLVYPATITSSQDVIVSAKAGGTVTELPVDLGTRVGAGTVLAQIEDVGTNFNDSSDFQNAQVDILENSAKQAKKSYDLAKRNYRNDGSFANKVARDNAKLSYESAQAQFKSALDSHRIISPIAATVTEKFVSVGDSINVGDPLVRISNPGKLRAQIFVSEQELASFKVGQKLDLETGGHLVIPAVVRYVSAQADANSKRFLVELLPQDTRQLKSGTVATVAVSITQVPRMEGTILLPLSAVTIGQNEQYIFVVDNGIAKKVSVKIENISGETAEVSLDLGADGKIIVEGNKLLHDGDAVVIQ